MPTFKSRCPDIIRKSLSPFPATLASPAQTSKQREISKTNNYFAVPQRLAVWDWLFESDFSPLARYEDHELRGYLNAVTNERLTWREVKEYSTYISTALVRKYGLKEGETVSLFSQNSIWYPVVMFGCLRAGKTQFPCSFVLN